MSPLNTFAVPGRPFPSRSRGSYPAPSETSRPRLALTCGIELLEGRVVPSTIMVKSSADSGPVTLRAAIEKADDDPHHLGGRMHLVTIKFATSLGQGLMRLDERTAGPHDPYRDHLATSLRGPSRPAGRGP